MDVRKIAHDMRTPLSAMSFAIAAAQQATDLNDARQRLDIAARNAKALSALIESLIETSLSDEVRLSLKEHLPLELVACAVDQIVPVAEQKQLRVKTEELAGLPPIIVDGTRIVRVLANLLSNAVRFSLKDGLIFVTAKTRVNDGHPVIVFSVSDEGPGVPPEETDRIFVEGVSLQKRSTGLGLAVCKEIVEAHGGRIWVETGREKGATFSFSIPTDFLVSSVLSQAREA